MVRAGVFIGVDKSGNLQVLRDAAAGAQRMRDWAIAQGMDEANVKLITDNGGKNVNPDLIYNAIKEIIDGPGVDQLILYFSGHGVIIARDEHWLLTDAPEKSYAAVNVKGSVDLAQFCGIKHVVIFSDACRSAPAGLQAQSVFGVPVFPNVSVTEKMNVVDWFRACGLGRTAAEFPDPSAAAGYSALYTNALLDALNGRQSEVLKPSNDPGDPFHYVWPDDLEKHLEVELPRRIKAMQRAQEFNQTPDSNVLSKQNWLSRIVPAVTHEIKGIYKNKSFALQPPPLNPQSIARNLVHLAADGYQPAFDAYMRETRTVPVAVGRRLVETIEKILAPFGPNHFEMESGIKVREARMARIFSPRVPAELLGSEGDILQVHLTSEPSTNVLIHLDGGIGTVIPAIKGYIAALTFDDGELVDVAYEPSVNHWRWHDYQLNAAQVRALRATAASVSQHGRFRLEHDDAIKIARDMQMSKSIDPTLAVYTAYAYHDLQMVECIRDMSGYLDQDIHVTFFDLALLGRQLVDKRVEYGTGIVPFFPLLSQGWALLGANRVRLHPALEGIERTMRDSLWSLFESSGMEKLTQVMRTGEVS